LGGSLANDGMTEDFIVLFLKAQMEISNVDKDDRYVERYNEIDGIAKYVTKTVVGEAANSYWPEPKPLISELRPVIPLDVSRLPTVMQDLVNDSAERMQCPPDFLAVGLIVVASSIIARNVVVQPKNKDTGWVEHPNLWGVIIGKPSLLKSPTLSIAMAGLEKLERNAREHHLVDMKEYTVDCDIAEYEGISNKTKAKDLVKKNKHSEAKALLLADQLDEEEEPTQARYIINDGTIEKIADLLCSNTRGLLVFRDELSGWFNNLNKPDKTNDRSFLLESWNGNKPYTVDRIGRGTTHIPTNRLSILGGIQPDVYRKIVLESSTGTQGGDGLLQRFQIAVYPDIKGKVTFVDKAPNTEAIKEFEEKLISLAGWSDDEPEEIVLKFNKTAFEHYEKWSLGNELLFRDDTLPPSLEAHYSKYRGLVPSIAAIFHVLNNDDFESNLLIDDETIASAISYVEYLRSHAERIYALPEQVVLKGAKSILKQYDKLADTFTVRDIYRKRWSGLTSKELVEPALAILEEAGHCMELKGGGINVGRSTIQYVKHPKYQLTKLTKLPVPVTQKIIGGKS